MKKHYPLAILLVITITVGLLTSHVGAAERKPSREDYANLEEIKRNQAAIAEARPAYTSLVTAATGKTKIDPELIDDYNRFVDLKGWNEAEVAALNKNGWNVDWSTMTLVDAQAVVAPKKTAAPIVPSTAADPSGSHWIWKGAPDYKNERLAYYQDKLRSLGITDNAKLKWLSAQLLQENGSFNEAGIYHGNCVFGIPQFNACGRHNMSASEWLRQHPEWKDWRFQLDQLAAEVAYRNELFNGEISCMILAHFHPNGSRGAKGLYASKGTCKSHKYYHTEVAQRLDLLVQRAGIVFARLGIAVRMAERFE